MFSIYLKEFIRLQILYASAMIFQVDNIGNQGSSHNGTIANPTTTPESRVKDFPARDFSIDWPLS
jgi:hypothetical protein